MCERYKMLTLSKGHNGSLLNVSTYVAVSTFIIKFVLSCRPKRVHYENALKHHVAGELLSLFKILYFYTDSTQFVNYETKFQHLRSQKRVTQHYEFLYIYSFHSIKVFHTLCYAVFMFYVMPYFLFSYILCSDILFSHKFCPSDSNTQECKLTSLNSFRQFPLSMCYWIKYVNCFGTSNFLWKNCKNLRCNFTNEFIHILNNNSNLWIST